MEWVKTAWKLKRLFMFPHSGVQKGILAMYLSPNGRQSKGSIGDFVLLPFWKTSKAPARFITSDLVI